MCIRSRYHLKGAFLIEKEHRSVATMMVNVGVFSVDGCNLLRPKLYAKVAHKMKKVCTQKGCS